MIYSWHLIATVSVHNPEIATFERQGGNVKGTGTFFPVIRLAAAFVNAKIANLSREK